MSAQPTPLITTAIAFAYLGGATFLAAGIYLSIRRGRLHPLLLLCVSALSFSWIEAPYDWAMYAQFPAAIPRMPSWWPLNMTWGGLPSPVPVGYMSYFALPAVIAAAIAGGLHRRLGRHRPAILLTAGLVTGFCWAFLFNAILGAHFGVFYYGKVIGGLALWQGTRHQYPIYDSIAMGVQVMVFTYLLGRTDERGRSLIEAWADNRTANRRQAVALSLAAVIVIGNLLYGLVFAPHLITKLAGWVNVGPTAPLFPGAPNQPLHG